MAHELNQLAEGVYSFADARTDAWHRLGNSVGHTMTAQEALEAGHLAGWNVRKIGLTATELTAEGVNSIEVPDRFATVYTNPVTKQTQYLGVVGSHYDPIQNEKHVDLLNAIVDESGAHFETAGSLRGGKETFISMKLPNTMKVGGFDPVELYLVALNDHSGNGAFKFIITPVRVVCRNTQQAALRNAKSSFSIRHVKGATGHVQEAREALGLTFEYTTEFDVQAEKMIARTLTDNAFMKITARLFDADIATTERQKNAAATHMAGIRSIWDESPTMEGIKGTRWGGYQAITEYTDHFMGIRQTGRDASISRAARAVQSQDMKKLKELAFASFARA